MSVRLRFSDPQYINWLRCASSLMILKESLHHYTEVGVRSLHSNVTSNVTTQLGSQNQCNTCSRKGIHYQRSTGFWSIGCKICQIWLGEILKKHDEPQSRTINWGNADITKWSTEAWEIAKIFMPNGQRHKTDLPRELDSSALLSLLKYCKEFHPLNVQLVSDIIEIRNKVHHSPDLRVIDTDKDAWIEHILLLVSNLNIQGVAYTDIEKLKTKDIDVSFQEQEIKIMQSMVYTVQSEVNAIKENIDSLKDSQSQHREDIDKVKQAAEDNKTKCIELQTQTQQLETDLKGQKSKMETHAQVISTLKTFIYNNPDLCKIKITEVLNATTNEINAVKSQLQTVESQFINIHNELSRMRTNQEAIETEVTSVKEEQETIRIEHEVVKADITAVKRGHKKLKVEHEVVKADITAVKRRQKRLKVEHAVVKSAQKKMKNQIENLEKNQTEKQRESSILSTVDTERLQKDLLLCYKFLNVIPISPLHDSYTTLLDDIFTSVIIEEKEKENVGHLREEGHPRISKEPIYLRSYHQLFGDKGSKRLILTGLMGSGKTVFCRKVVQTWCRVKSAQVDPKSAGERQVSYTSALDGEDILSQFEFLFFIDLAKVNNQEDLSHAIHRQCSIPNEIENKSFLCKLLRNMPEKILIILDGLDEMGSQTPAFVNDLLERKLYPQIAVLVSTRPWQVSNLNLQLHSHYDLLLTVQGFDEKSALDFATKVIHAHDKNVSDSLIMDMIASLTSKKIFATFRSMPLLLLFLINVWCNDRSLPDQYSVLYSKIIDCMIMRYLNKTKGKNNGKNLKWVEMSDSNIKLMESTVFVKTFGNAFLDLTSKLSYELLLQRKHGTTVIISREELLMILDQHRETAESKLCVLLECGILSESDVFSPLHINCSISFLHLTIQEFFSAVYLILNEDVFQEFLSSWSCLNDVLQNENLVIFICGLSPDLGARLFSHICEICDHDSKVLEYRDDPDCCEHRYAVKHLCSLYHTCLNEVEGSASLPLSDIMIEEQFNQYEPPEFLCKLIALGLNSAIKSFRLPSLILPASFITFLCNCTQLQSLVLRNLQPHDSIFDLSRLKDLTCLTLCTVTMSSGCSESLCRSISTCTQLQTLGVHHIKLHDSILDLSRLINLTYLELRNVAMSSECIESLSRGISNCTHLQTLHLIGVTLHDSILVFSGLTNLTDLVLQNVTMSSLCSESLSRSISNGTHLQTLDLNDITLHDGILDLSRLTNLTCLRMWNVTRSNECSKSLYSSISNSTHLQTLDLDDITLHDSILDLSRLTNLIFLTLVDVTMSSECSESLCRSISNCTHLQNLVLSVVTLHGNIFDLSKLTNLTCLRLRNVTMSSECSESLCRSISNCTHLQTLDLLDVTLHDNILDLSRLINLTCLKLRNLTMSIECNQSFCRGNSNCTHLQTLKLKDMKKRDSVLHLSRLTNITCLRLQNVTMSSECRNSLCRSISNCTNLQTLKLHDITLHDSILDLSRLINLFYFRLQNATMSSKCSESLCRSISNCTHLETLKLHDITLHDSILDLSSLTNLIYLRLSNVTMSSECSESLSRSISQCTHLQTLDLNHITLHDSILDLSRLIKLTYLTLLNVTMCSECSESLCSSISNCTNLQTLDLLDVTLHDSIFDLSRLTNLTSLFLMSVTMSSECTESLHRSINKSTYLQFLNLNDITLHDSVLDLSRLTNLTDLWLCNVTMSSKCSESLCRSISNCTDLQTLKLDDITLHDNILDLNRLTNLTYLMLHNVTMSSECSESLCRGIINCTHLQTLKLNDISLHDSILDLSRLTNLTSLRLHNVTMSSECSESLCRGIINCTHLQTLKLNDISLHNSNLDLSRLTNITCLRLHNVTMSSECSESLSRSISNCTHLQTLDLNDITLHDSILDLSRLINLIYLTLCSKSQCTSISNCTHLQTLVLNGVTLHDSIIDLSRLTYLTDLGLRNVTMSSKGSESLCRSISNCTNLQTLRLHDITLHFSITDLSRPTNLIYLTLCSESLCRSISNCTHLQTLKLHDITLHDSILDLSRLTGLTDLILRNVTMSSECTKSLCKSINNCTHLQALKLCDIKLHDSILDLNRLRNLKQLYIIRVHMSSPCHQALSASVTFLKNNK